MFSTRFNANELLASGLFKDEPIKGRMSLAAKASFSGYSLLFGSHLRVLSYS